MVICGGGIISCTHLTDWNGIRQEYSQILLQGEGEKESKLYPTLGSVCLSFHVAALGMSQSIEWDARVSGNNCHTLWVI